MFLNLKKYFSDYNRSQKIFILSIVVCVFFISCEYGITRPASTSIFISNFTSKMFPYSWILAVPLNFLVVFLYNRFLPTLGCFKTFFLFVLSIIIINSLTALFVDKFTWLIFLQFIFKDVYILLAFKQTWSMIHTTIDTRKAKFLYGLMFGIGGLGSIVGGVVSGFFAVDLKSQNLFLFSIPLYLIVFAFYNLALKNSKVPKNDFKEMIIEENTNPKEAFSLIKKNNFLTYVLLIVVFMQVSTAFLDYQYNVFLERTIPDIDLRTAYTGKITSLINSITTCFQFFGGFILIHFLGLKRSHLIVPILLGLNSLAFFFFPFFSMAVFAFVSIKSLDYSLFAIVREMLYIPLKIDEKYRAKALIDVFAYRAAKAFSSLFLIFIQNLSGLNIILLISIISMIIYAFWINVVTLMFKKHKQFIFQKE